MCSTIAVMSSDFVIRFDHFDSATKYVGCISAHRCLQMLILKIHVFRVAHENCCERANLCYSSFS